MKLRILETKAIPQPLRAAYLDSLSEAQELYLESLVKKGKCLLIRHSEEAVGYAVVCDHTVVEFYLSPQASPWVAEGFQIVLTKSKATRALCKTFDTFMVKAVATMPARVRTSGVLFRTIIDSSFQPKPSIGSILCTQDDVETILGIHDGFFSGRGEILSYVREKGIFLYRLDGHAVGCGIFKRIIPNRNDFDIGMVVAPAFRRKGLGSYIAAHVKSHCFHRKYNPVCGCDIDNSASRRSLEKAGFASLYSIIEFAY